MNELINLINHNYQDYLSIAPSKTKTSVNGELFSTGVWPETEFPIEAGRYALIWSPSCPRAQRLAISIRLLDMSEKIQLISLLPDKTIESKWRLPESSFKEQGIRLLEELSPNHRLVQPLLYDLKAKRVVTDDQYSLGHYLARDWTSLQTEATYNYYPKELETLIEKWNGYIFIEINQRIYQAGYETDKDKKAIYTKQFFNTLRLLDQHLKNQEFLLGDKLSEPDLRLFPNLLRFYFYYHQFELNNHRIEEYPAIVAYAKRIFKLPEVSETSQLNEMIQTHYFSPDNQLRFGNKYSNQTVESTFGWLIN